MMTSTITWKILVTSSIPASRGDNSFAALTLLLLLLLHPPLHSSAVVAAAFAPLSTSTSALAFSPPWTAASPFSSSSSSSSSSSWASSCNQLRQHKPHRQQQNIILPPVPSRTTSGTTDKIITNGKITLQMSCIPEDNDTTTENNNNSKNSNNNKNNDNVGESNTFLFPFEINLNLPNKVTQLFRRPTLPPPPEDPIALSGDILALFVYSYMDHTINEMYAQLSTRMGGSFSSSSSISSSISSSSAVQLMDASTSSAITATTTTTTLTASGIQQPLPVWFDTTHLQTFGSNWLAITHIDTPYAPAIASSGLAFVCIATSWLLCGYISGAFLHRNTIECNPSQAMIITFQTWMGTALLMILLALGSDKLWSALDNINALSPQARGGLTKADADYIFDSLSVLGFWRFMLNWFLGYR